MGAFFHDLALVQHQDSIRMLDGGQSVGDDYRTAILDQFAECVLDQNFRFGIYV